MVVENLTVEGEPTKRYRVCYGGEQVAESDTAQEAWDRYRDYEDKIRPVTDRDKRCRYQFFDGRKEIDIVIFRNVIKAEQRTGSG